MIRVVLSATLAALLVAGCVDYESIAPWTAPTPSVKNPKPSPYGVCEIVDPFPDEVAESCVASTALSPGPAPARRLTNTEYNNTVRDLLGTEQRPGDRLPPEEEILGFDNNAAGRSITQIHIERYMDAAEKLVAELFERRPPELFDCDPDLRGEVFCADALVAEFGWFAFRRRLTQEEVDRFRADFTALRADDMTFDEALGTLFEVILQSPHFLYRLEFGEPDTDGDGVVALTPYELASRLSYLLWGSMPDEALMAYAETGALSDPINVALEARRLLRDRRAEEGVLHFHRQWLQIDQMDSTFKSPELYPGFDNVKHLLADETEAFVREVVFGEDHGDLVTLLTAPWSMLNQRLAEHYGVQGVTSRALTRVEMDATQRAGFLTHASVLSTHAKENQTSPILRGKFIRENLLCDPIEPPPANIDVTPPEVDPDLTTRERFDAHSEDPLCAGCHLQMEPLGFTFEAYDLVGRHRTTENGLHIETWGDVACTWDMDGIVDDAVQLAQKLSESEQVHACYVTQWFQYAHGRKVTDADACSTDQLRETFVTSGLDIQELLVALTGTDAFRYRPAVDPPPFVEPDDPAADPLPVAEEDGQ